MTLKGMVAQNVPFFGMQRASLGLAKGPGPSVDFHFNPTELKFTRKVDWKVDSVTTSSNNASAQWNGSSPTTLTIVALFDGVRDQPLGSVLPEVEQLMAWTNPKGEGGEGAASGLAAIAHGDIKGAVKAFGGAIKAAATDKSDPPMLQFTWGKLKINGMTSFVGYLTNIDVTYEMFARDGTPLRATVSLSLMSGAEGPKRTNPTSGAEQSDRRYVLRRGETLQSVAYAVYGDAAAWRHIAEANDIDDPFRVPLGFELLLPERSELVGPIR
jgi:Contractile injection system tube protein